MAVELAEFFLITLPGLEDLVQSEVKDWYPELETKSEHGGVTLFAPLAQGLALNRVLKIPTRILLRVARFTCRDFPKLYNKIADLRWEQWHDPSCALEVHASVTRSRLKMKKRIEETCCKGWQARQKKLKITIPKQEGPTAELYVRLLDNLCTLSLDTSGARLHKRGERALIGEAPLRENLAAALIQWVGRSLGPDATDEIELIDPMMGSGTILLEAAGRDQSIGQREFAYQAFVAPPEQPPQLQCARPRISAFVGYESDAKTFTAATSNLRRWNSVYLKQEDFFHAEPLPQEAKKVRWVIANPPYGERLKVEQPLREFYAHLFAQAERVARPERACFLLPAQVSGRLDLPKPWKVLEKRRFSNGGIAVVAMLFGRI